MQTAIIILNYNGRHFLEKFLPSVVQFSQNAEIIVVDNGSLDRSGKFLKKNYPQIRLISLDKNYGFCGGYNRALKEIQAKYFVLLNSDVEVSQNWLEPMIDLLEKNEQIAACQPKIKSFQDKTKFEDAGAGGGMIDKYGFTFCRGRIFDKTEEDKGQYNDEKEIFWASGACLMVRSKVFEQMNGFEESFFAHMEEIDLCWRINNANYKVFHCGKSEVYHVGGGTLPKASSQKMYLNFRNNLVMMIRNLPSKILFSTVFKRLCLDGIAAIKFLFTAKFSYFWAVLQAHFYLYVNFSDIKAQRKKTQNQVINHSQTGVYQKSVVWEYFIKGKKKYLELD